jgi:5-methylcytosine-specific restriction endonuclease McrA
MRELLRQRDGWKCQLCKEDFSDPFPAHPHPKSVTVDHIIPIWKGGTDAQDNLRLAHRICNMKRSGEELSPAQRLRDQKATAAWRQKLGPEASEPAETKD